MFAIGLAGWIVADSTALLANAFDMLLDASAFGFACLAMEKSLRLQRLAARWSSPLLIAPGSGESRKLSSTGCTAANHRGQQTIGDRHPRLLITVPRRERVRPRIALRLSIRERGATAGCVARHTRRRPGQRQCALVRRCHCVDRLPLHRPRGRIRDQCVRDPRGSRDLEGDFPGGESGARPECGFRVFGACHSRAIKATTTTSSSVNNPSAHDGTWTKR